MANDERLLTPAEVSARLGVPVATLAQWRCYRRGPAFVKVGKHVRYERGELDRYLREATVEPLPAA